MNLIELITGSTGNQVAEKAENKFGISKNQIIALLAVSAPLIISYLRNKSKDQAEAEALNKALDKDHDGSILDNVDQLENRQDEGGSILNHIFGNERADVENQLSNKTGISLSKIGPVLAMLAPLFMGFIGKEKKSSQTNSGRIGDILGNILGASGQNGTESNPFGDLLGGLFNTEDKSSNPIEDIMNNVFSKKDNGDKSNGLGGILGDLFGK